MRFSVNGCRQLENEEGFRGKPYKCAAGRDTVGFGTVITPAEVEKYNKVPMTREEARQRMLKKVDEIIFVIQKTVTVQLNQNQVDALIIFIYNIGVNAWKKSTLLRKLNNRAFQEAAKEFRRWCHDDDGQVIPGLLKRQERTAELFLKLVNAPAAAPAPPKEDKK